MYLDVSVHLDAFRQAGCAVRCRNVGRIKLAIAAESQGPESRPGGTSEKFQDRCKILAKLEYLWEQLCRLAESR
jgi:hypothetical protein